MCVAVDSSTGRKYTKFGIFSSSARSTNLQDGSIYSVFSCENDLLLTGELEHAKWITISGASFERMALMLSCLARLHW